MFESTWPNGLRARVTIGWYVLMRRIKQLLFPIMLLGTLGVGLLMYYQTDRNTSLSTYLGGSLLAYAYSGAASLLGSLILFLLWALVRRLFGKPVGLVGLFEKGVFKKRYLVSGAPGAMYISFSAFSITVLGRSVAVMPGVFGFMMYSVVAEWRVLGKKKLPVVLGAICILVATGYASLSQMVEAMEISPLAGLCHIGMMVLGAGIAWQLYTLGVMAKASSVVAAAIVSSATGFTVAATGVLVVGMLSGTLIPDNPWPGLANGWKYLAFAAGFGLIWLSARVKPKLSRPLYGSLVMCGNLLGGLLSELWYRYMFGTEAPLGVQAACCVLAGVGVVLCLQRPSEPQSLSSSS